VLKDIKRRLINLPGWHTKRKFVVIDSDDWGSIGMPSIEVYNNLKDSGFKIENNPYLKYDALESEDDLISLLEVLKSFKDKNGRNPVITANIVVANPDFERIQNSGYEKYFYELFTDSYKRYPRHEKSFELMKQGVNEQIFFPQFHAREHLNISYWMKSLQNGHPQILTGFKNNYYILDNATHPDIIHSCTSAHYPKSESESMEIEGYIKDGLRIFDEIFGFRSRSFTGTGHIWSSRIENMLKQEGVRYIKGLIVQREPKVGTGNFRSKYHYTGQRNKFGQIHIVRNSFFEPGLTNEKNKCVSDCLDRISIAFSSGKPAVISTHRINYMGFIFEDFRNENLQLLKQLLTQLLKKYPDIEFLNSDELGTLIDSSS
jgi:hypothetical protein